MFTSRAPALPFAPHISSVSQKWPGSFQNSRKLALLARARSSYAASLPQDEAELLSQIQTSVQQALADGHSLLEVQFPVDQVSRGDCIATSELNANMQAMRRFCEVFEWLGQAERVRVFFPDAGEMNIARRGAGKNPATGQWDMDPMWHDWPGPLDYLLRDDLLSKTALQLYDQYSEYTGEGKTSVTDDVRIDDLLYVIGYPYEDYEEMWSVMELSRVHGRRTIVFNGSLDNVRTAFLPFGKLNKLKTEFIPKFEAAYYIHTFRGQNPGVLFRAYPGPWKVLVAVSDGGFKCIHEYEDRPSLRDVANEYFAGAGQTVSLISTSGESDGAEQKEEDIGEFYEILGVQEGISPKDLQKAYRTLAMENHPDRGGDTQTFYMVNKAYAVLKQVAVQDEVKA